MGLRKSRYKGTNRGTKGTVVNQTLLLLPRFPYKNKHFARYLDFRIGKNGIIKVQTADSQNRCACSISITYRFSTSILKMFMTPKYNFQKRTLRSQKTINCNARSNMETLCFISFSIKNSFKILPSYFLICQDIFTEKF